jgi:hypothetical protein
MLEGGQSMKRYEASVLGRLVPAEGGTLEPEEIERVVDLVAAELEKLDACDIDVSTNLATGQVRVSVTCEAEDLLLAQVDGGAQLRSSFHAAMVTTAGWSIDWINARTVPEGDLEDDLERDLIDA